MGRVFVVELQGSCYRCKFCETHLALADDVLSRLNAMTKFTELDQGTNKVGDKKGKSSYDFGHTIGFSFNCRKGRAYLFSKVVNITVGAVEERMMLSGMHTVEDIFCCCCGQLVGWKYVAAHEKNQKYKEGKFVLERWRIAEDLTEEFNLDTHPSSSDAENP